MLNMLTSATKNHNETAELYLVDIEKCYETLTYNLARHNMTNGIALTTVYVNQTLT
jgi:hypothetical protein